MYLSKFFIPTAKENPSDAKIISHQYLIRGGFVKQLTSGIYSWLPVGVKVLNKIQQIIHKEMANISAIEILMPCIQPAELWQESGRYESYGREMLRIKDRHDNDCLFSPTHEEVMTDIFRSYVKSYKSLPLNFYHMTWKFRDEIRPKFGLMRGREFLMKDGYSFDIDFNLAQQTYKKYFSAYMKIFKKMNLRVVPVKADSGAIGGNLSHEFHILAKSGESNLFYDSAINKLETTDFETFAKLYAAADEMHDQSNCDMSKENIISSRGIEVGHIFYFADKYSKIMKAFFQNNKGINQSPFMGSYGIGVSRLVAAIVEVHHDEKGIKWPIAVAPFAVCIVNLMQNNQNTQRCSEELYELLLQNSVDVLYDDTDNTAGYKLANVDLIGIPLQIIIGNKFINEEVIELKNRNTDALYSCNKNNLLEKIKQIINIAI